MFKSFRLLLYLFICCKPTIGWSQFYLAPSIADAQINFNQTCDWQAFNYEPMPFLTVQEWTWNTEGCSQGSIRGLYKFDLNVPSQPNELYDNRAEMLFFFPDGSTETHQYYTSNGANEFLIRPITEDWTETLVTWDNQPLADEVAAIEVPPSSTMPSSEDYVVDVTPLAADWICNGLPNFGVSLRQVFEGETYRRVTFTTREHAVEAERPSVKLYYARIEAQGPSTVCMDQDFIINGDLQFAAQPENYNFSWMDLTTGTVYNGQSPSVSLHELGLHTFMLTVTNNTCQTATDLLEITVESTTLNVSAGPNQSGSCADIFTLEANSTDAAGDVTYTWSEGGNAIAVGPSTQVQTPQTALYLVTAQDGCGSAQDEVEIEILPSVIEITAPQSVNTTCTDLVEIIPTLIGAQGVVSYEWTSDNVLLSSETALSAVFQETSIVELGVSDQCGNTATEVINVTVEQNPIIIELASDTTICQGQQVQLTAQASGGSGILSGVWTGLEEMGDNPVVSPTSEITQYTYTVTDQCGNSAQESMVVNTENIEASFEATTENSVDYFFTDASVGADSIVWYINDEAMDSFPVFTYHNNSLNTFIIQLEAIGQGGCKQYASQVYEPPTLIYIPNSFSPNSDGLNDIWLVQGTNIQNIDLHVYNRWGETIFYSDKVNQAWTGEYLNGNYFVPDGTYYYHLIYADSKNQRYVRSGHILVVR